MVRCDECGHGPINVPDDSATFQITNRDSHGVDRTYDFCTIECAYVWLGEFPEAGHAPLELSEFGRQPRNPPTNGGTE